MMCMSQMIEELSMNAWPSLQTRLYDGWILRFSEGYTKRANSINPIYRSHIDIEEKIDSCERIYRRRGLPVVFKLIDGEEQRGIESVLDARAYARLDETIVMTMPLGPTEHGIEFQIDRESDFSEEWEKGFIECNKIAGRYHAVMKAMLRNIDLNKVVASKRIDGKMIACGFGAQERGCVGIFDIVVEESMRRRGIGEGIVRGILERAREQGAKTAYLQVMVNNAAAMNLYRKIGFGESYRYWYRKKGE